MKSLFSRAIMSAILVLLIGIGILTIGLNFMYKTFMVDRYKEELLNLADKMSERVIRNNEGVGIDTRALRTEMVNLERYAEVKVLVMINKSHILTTDIDLNSDLALGDLTAAEIEGILETKVPLFRESKFKIYDEDEYYSLIYPIQLTDNLKVTLFLNKSLPNINHTVAEINQFSLLTIFVVFIYAAFILYISTKKLTDEIQLLNKGVKAMAKGDFETKLDLDRDDEIGELSRNLRYMGNSLNEIELSRRKFVSNVSHDLRSPMTSISGYINGILDGTIPEDRWMHYLGIVSDESNRMIKLINDLLDLSKIQNEGYQLSKRETDLNSLILSVMDSFERRLHEKNVNVELDFMKNGCAVCDEMLIFRVINNLVDNAVKFVNEGGTIGVKTEQKRDKIIVGVKNTGSYIEEEKLKSIWERFTKLDDSRGAEKSSSGLGLSIVREIINSHGEKIDVYSKEDSGTGFVFSLELCPTQSSEKRKGQDIDK